MRLKPSRPKYVIDTASGDPGRPVRFAVLGLTFAMTTAEAIGMATRLADAVQALNHQQQENGAHHE